MTGCSFSTQLAVTHHLLRMLTGMLLSLVLQRKWTLVFIISHIHGLFISQIETPFFMSVYISEKWTFWGYCKILVIFFFLCMNCVIDYIISDVHVIYLHMGAWRKAFIIFTLECWSSAELNIACPVLCYIVVSAVWLHSGKRSLGHLCYVGVCE